MVLCLIKIQPQCVFSQFFWAWQSPKFEGTLWQSQGITPWIYSSASLSMMLFCNLWSVLDFNSAHWSRCELNPLYELE
jgi:hypothetical protein